MLGALGAPLGFLTFPPSLGPPSPGGLFLSQGLASPRSATVLLEEPHSSNLEARRWPTAAGFFFARLTAYFSTA
jgi:hypothetical protein